MAHRCFMEKALWWQQIQSLLSTCYERSSMLSTSFPMARVLGGSISDMQTQCHLTTTVWHKPTRMISLYTTKTYEIGTHYKTFQITVPTHYLRTLTCAGVTIKVYVPPPSPLCFQGWYAQRMVRSWNFHVTTWWRWCGTAAVVPAKENSIAHLQETHIREFDAQSVSQ